MGLFSAVYAFLSESSEDLLDRCPALADRAGSAIVCGLDVFFPSALDRALALEVLLIRLRGGVVGPGSGSGSVLMRTHDVQSVLMLYESLCRGQSAAPVSPTADCNDVFRCLSQTSRRVIATMVSALTKVFCVVDNAESLFDFDVFPRFFFPLLIYIRNLNFHFSFFFFYVEN